MITGGISIAGSAGAVGWDDVRTITFDEYNDVPRLGPDTWALDTWVPPEGWTNPIDHHVSEWAATDGARYGSEWEGPRPDSLELRNGTRWAKGLYTRDYRSFGRPRTSNTPTSLSASYQTGGWFPKLGFRSLDIGVDLDNYDFSKQPASGQYRGTVHGYREDYSAPHDAPERWVEVVRRDFDLPVPTFEFESLGGINNWRNRSTTQFVNVDLTGFSHLDRLAFTAVDPDGVAPEVKRVSLDNIQVNAGTTHAFFLGAPDMTNGAKIDSVRDTNAMRSAMEEAFGLESWRRVVLPDISLNQTPENAAQGDVFAGLDDIKRRLVPGDNFVFHYSGHGVSFTRDDEGNRVNGNEALFLGRDGNGDEVLLEDDALAAYFASDPIWSQVDKVFILDACHSGGFWTSTPDFVAAKGRENGLSGPSDLATLPRTALLAGAPEANEALSFADQSDLDQIGLPGTQDFVVGQGMLTAAVVSALQSGEDGFALADLNDDGLSFRELLEFVRVSEINEQFGSDAGFDNDLAVRRMRRWLDRNGHADVSVGWFLKSRFVGYERNLAFDAWADEPIEVDWAPFGAFTDDFGTAGLMELMTAAEIASSVPIGEDLAGDLNRNGQVEQGDLNLVLNNWGRDTLATGVPNGWLATEQLTGTVDQDELNAVLLNWGALAAPDFSATTVPEPAGLGAVVAALGLRRRRGRRG
ncbi:MAG: caspase family protein [Planctomycetota bacterium]